MKSLIILLFVLFSLTCIGQEIPDYIDDVATKNTVYFFQHTSSDTAKVVGELIITIPAKEVYKTSSGQLYVIIKSKSGNESRKYLGWYYKDVTWGEGGGSTMFCNQDMTRAWIFQIGKYAQPYKVEFPVIWYADPNIPFLKDSIQ